MLAIFTFGPYTNISYSSLLNDINAHFYEVELPAIERERERGLLRITEGTTPKLPFC